VENGASLLNAAVVATANDRSAMHNHRAYWNTTFG